MNNDFLELAKKRQSVRKYSSKKVEKEVLNRCLEAARIAPSASNSQPWKFIIIDDEILREKIARLTFDTVANFNRFVIHAQVLVVLVIEKPKLITRIGKRIKKIDYPYIDIGIAAEHFCLQATSEGLGTCMLGWFKEKKIKQSLTIPKSKKIGLIISVGYPPQDYKQRNRIRKRLDEITSYNSYK